MRREVRLGSKLGVKGRFRHGPDGSRADQVSAVGAVANDVAE